MLSVLYHHLISLATLALSLSLFPSMWPPSLCHRVTPWLWAQWGRAVGECRVGLLQRRDSTFPKVQQVQQL